MLKAAQVVVQFRLDSFVRFVILTQRGVLTYDHGRTSVTFGGWNQGVRNRITEVRLSNCIRFHSTSTIFKHSNSYERKFILHVFI